MNKIGRGIDRYIILAKLYTQQNPPGQGSLIYRAEDFASAFQHMVSDLQTHRNLDADLPALQLNTDETNNWTIGLLQACAMVVDVLTFYQERIANEGFLRTATERRSIVELTRSINYELAPGVAASTYLAFTVRETAAEPSRRVTIPPFTLVQSVPTQNQLSMGSANVHKPIVQNSQPQIFETTALFVALGDWNTLELINPTGAHWRALRKNVTALRVAGVKTNLVPGETILILGQTPTQANPSPLWVLKTIQSVEPNQQKGYTRVTFESGDIANDDTPIEHPTVHALKLRAPLYAFDQGGVHCSPVVDANWSPSSLGMPNTTVNALVGSENARLYSGTDKGAFRSVDDGAHWQEASAGLLKSKVMTLASGAEHRLYAGTETGKVFVSTDEANSWKIPSRPRMIWSALVSVVHPSISALPKTVVRKLATFAASNREQLIAATDDGVFASTDRGASWDKLAAGNLKPGTKVGTAWTLATAQNRWKRLAGTDQGVVYLVDDKRDLKPAVALGAVIGIAISALNTSPDKPVNLPGTNIPQISSALTQITTWFYYLKNDLALLVGIASVCAVMIGALWYRRWLKRLDPIGIPVHALLAFADNRLIAGTANGIYQWNNQTKQWQTTNESLLMRVCIIAADQAGALDGQVIPNALRDAFDQAKINLGDTALVTMIKPGERWTLTALDNPVTYTLAKEANGISVYRPHDIRALATGAKDTLYAGTQDGVILRSTDNGNTWARFDQNLNLGEIKDLLIASGGIFAAGVTLGEDPDHQWTHWHLQNRQIDLDKTYPGVTAGNWVVLSQGQNATLSQANQVCTTTGKNGRKNGSYTSIRVDRDAALATLDRRTSHVLTQSIELAPFDDTPLTGNTLVLDKYVPGLEAEHTLVINGQRARLALTEQAAPRLQLVSQDGLNAQPVRAGESFIVITPPPSMTTSEQRWLVKNRYGFAGYLSVTSNQVTLEPAQDDDEIVGEVCFVRTADVQAQTTLVLRDPLGSMYDRTTVTIYGNVVPATHGQTIDTQVQDSVTGTDNIFILKRKPLTYVQAAQASGVQDTLTVNINKATWHRVSSLANVNSDARVYMLRQDADGNSVLIFGNGKHGALIPSGTGNVTATFRIGSGTAGNVPMNSLTMLRTRPAGIQKVTNPISATGGAEPEPADHARVNAPKKIRTIQRIVSLKDYEDFANAFDGIGKAQARTVWDGRTRRLHLTIAGAAGTPVEPSSSLYLALTDAINQLCATPTVPMQTDSFQPLYFNVSAALILDPAYASNADDIIAHATQQLVTTFAFNAREFGQSVAASEIIAALQRTQGVSAVELNGLYVLGNPIAMNDLLSALPARWEDNRIVPAQLLVVNATGDQGITLIIQSAGQA